MSELCCVQELTPISNSCINAPVWYCTFSPSGQWMASCHGIPDLCIRIWKFENNEWILSSTLTDVHERTIRHVAFAPSNHILASASFDGTVGIWECVPNTNGFMKESIWECTTQLEGHENEVKCVVWNSTGTLLATCGRDKSVWVWESLLSMDSQEFGGGDGEFECLAVLHGHTGDVKYVLFAPSNNQWGDGEEILLSASYDDTIKCWAEDGGDWYCAATLSAHTSTVWCLACTLDGTRLISASDDSSIAIWKCYTGSDKQGYHGDGIWKCVGKLESAHDLAIYHVDCFQQNYIASVSADTNIQIYHQNKESTSDMPLFTSYASIQKAHGEHDINCIKFHPTHSTFMTCGDDGIIKLFKIYK